MGNNRRQQRCIFKSEGSAAKKFAADFRGTSPFVRFRQGSLGVTAVTDRFSNRAGSIIQCGKLLLAKTVKPFHFCCGRNRNPKLFANHCPQISMLFIMQSMVVTG